MRRPYSSSIFVERSTLFVDDEGKLTRKELASPEAALAEHAKLVAKREKAGWRTDLRISTPWLDYRRDLEDVAARVLNDARAANVFVDDHKWSSGFWRGSASSTPADKVPIDEYAELVRIGDATIRFQLGDAALSFQTEFTLGRPRTYWVEDGTDTTWFWRRLDNRKPTDGGTFEDGKLVSHVGDERVTHASAADFRTWFARYIRDDVMGFTIAELAR